VTVSVEIAVENLFVIPIDIISDGLVNIADRRPIRVFEIYICQQINGLTGKNISRIYL
jgi:hypothetical protein